MNAKERVRESGVPRVRPCRAMLEVAVARSEMRVISLQSPLTLILSCYSPLPSQAGRPKLMWPQLLYVRILLLH